MDIGNIVSLEVLNQLYHGSMRIQQFSFIGFMVIAIGVGVIIQSGWPVMIGLGIFAVEMIVVAVIVMNDT